MASSARYSHGSVAQRLALALHRELAEGEQPGLIYSRMNNPDLEILEDRLTLWDDAEAALRDDLLGRDRRLWRGQFLPRAR